MFKFNRRTPRSLGLSALRATKNLVQKTIASQGLMNLFFVLSPTNLKKRKSKKTPKQIKLRAVALPKQPIPAHVLSSTYAGKSGSRAFRTYVPKARAEGISGIVMMLHGCTQNPEDFAKGTQMNSIAERHGFVVIYPEQTGSENPQKCWNWFKRSDQQRGVGEPEILMGIARQAMTHYKVDRDHTFVCGLSAGGAMAVILGQVYPDVFSAIGVHSGMPYGAASNVPSALAAMAGRGRDRKTAKTNQNLRTIIFHGTDDHTVHPANGETIANDARNNLPLNAREVTKTGTRNGRKYSKTISTRSKGQNLVEYWVVEGLGHAWSGGNAGASYADPLGPKASAEMIRFFFQSVE